MPVRTRSAVLARAHDAFLETGRADAETRPVVAESWQRSLAAGLDPERVSPPLELVDAELDDYRASHPLAPMMPVIRRLLVEDASDSGSVVAVADHLGRLLWVEGQRRLRSRTEGIGFVEGSDWAESVAGTNAPGTALAIDRPVQIIGGEHLARPVMAWSCAAAPVHDPDTGAVLGVIDLTGGAEVSGPQALSAVRATVAVVERELQLQRLLHPEQTAAPRARLRALGVASCVLESPRARTRLGLRHSELLVLLGEHGEDGLTGEELAVGLSDDELASVTLRAELSRLRTVLTAHGLTLAGRPYRLDAGLRSDVTELRQRLALGDVAGALDLYRGDLLPASDAPGVRRLRDRLRTDLRHRLIGAGDPEMLLRFGETEHGRLDWEIWQAAYLGLDPSAPGRARVRDHLDFLAAELG
ncbi:MAG: transcriptional regulator [Nocardioides sp.]|uniref:transcriptional regulator n=1 Tax=Nocardioides sp. TaxID=35761 RepID=UPI0039E53B73